MKFKRYYLSQQSKLPHKVKGYMMFKPTMLGLFAVVLIMVSGAHAESMRFKIARQYEKNGELDKAVAEYRAGLLEEPRNVGAYLALAGISGRKNDHHAAIKHYQDALQIEPTSVIGYLGAADSYEKIGAFEKSVANWRNVAQYAKGATAEQAEKHVARIMDLIRNDAKSKVVVEKKRGATGRTFNYSSDYYKKALHLTRMGKDKEALAYWRKVLKNQPGHPGAYYYAGENRYNLKDYEKAVFNFKRSIGFPEKGFNAHYYLGRIAEKDGKAEEAIGHYTRYIPLTKKQAGKTQAQKRIDRLKPLIGKKIEDVADPDEKEEELVNVDPQQVQEMEEGRLFVVHNKDMKGATDLQQAWKNYKVEKNFNQAIERLKQVGLKYNSSPNNIAAQFNLMNLYYLLGLQENAENAGQLLLRSDSKEPYRSATHFLLAKMYFEMDDSKKARNHFNNVKTGGVLGPLVAEKTELSGKLAQLENQNSEGLALLEKAILLQSSPSKKDSLRLSIAQNYVYEGNHKKAKVHLKQILTNCNDGVNPELCRKAYYELADLYYKNQIWNLAEKYYSEVVETYPDTVNSPWGYYQLGNVKRAKSEYEAAVQFYKKVYNNYPKSYWAEQARWKRVDTIWRKEYDFALER